MPTPLYVARRAIAKFRGKEKYRCGNGEGKSCVFQKFQPYSGRSVHTIQYHRPIAFIFVQLFALCLLLLGLILAAVGTGLTQWARFETEREFPDESRNSVSNGRTYKTQVCPLVVVFMLLQWHLHTEKHIHSMYACTFVLHFILVLHTCTYYILVYLLTLFLYMIRLCMYLYM